MPFNGKLSSFVATAYEELLIKATPLYTSNRRCMKVYVLSFCVKFSASVATAHDELFTNEEHLFVYERRCMEICAFLQSLDLPH